MLLASLELEKLLYELRYEAGHRPDWVAIPAGDLLRDGDTMEWRPPGVES